MRILFLLQVFPYPPVNGISSKAFNLIRYLASKGWRCDLLCFGTAAEAARSAELEAAVPGARVLAVIPPAAGAGRAARKVLCLLKGLPPSIGEFESREFKAALLAAGGGGYDAVHYDVINMAQYLPWGPKAPSVFSSNDAVSLFYRRMSAEASGTLNRLYLKLAGRLIAAFERKIYPRFDRVHVVSEEDAAHLKNSCPGLGIEVIPIAVDASFSPPDRPAAKAGKSCPCVVFSGNLGIPGIANGLFDFLSAAYPDVRAGGLPFEFRVLGPNASAADERRLLSYPGLKYARWAENYKDFLSEADIVLALDRSGTGIKTRVLEAMALGKPVIGTKIAFGGISARDGSHCLVCNTPSETGAALKRLLADGGQRERIGKAARELILSTYSMSVTGPKWEALYTGLKRTS